MDSNGRERRFPVILDHALHDCKFQPGKNGENAILFQWIDAIKIHKEAAIKEAKVKQSCKREECLSRLIRDESRFPHRQRKT
jgi:hypothetical protein